MGTVHNLRSESILRRGWTDDDGRDWTLAGAMSERDIESYERDIVGFRRAFGEHCTKMKVEGRWYLWRLKYPKAEVQI